MRMVEKPVLQYTPRGSEVPSKAVARERERERERERGGEGERDIEREGVEAAGKVGGQCRISFNS